MSVSCGDLSECLLISTCMWWFECAAVKTRVRCLLFTGILGKCQSGSGKTIPGTLSFPLVILRDTTTLETPVQKLDKTPDIKSELKKCRHDKDKLILRKGGAKVIMSLSLMSNQQVEFKQLQSSEKPCTEDRQSSTEIIAVKNTNMKKHIVGA